MKFNLVGVSPQDIWELHVCIYSGDSNSSHFTFLYSVFDDSWDESSVTWNNQPSHVQLLDGEKYVGGNYAWIVFKSVELTAFINDQINGDGVASFKFIDSDEDSTSQKQTCRPYDFSVQWMRSYLVKGSPPQGFQDDVEDLCPPYVGDEGGIWISPATEIEKIDTDLTSQLNLPFQHCFFWNGI